MLLGSWHSTSSGTTYLGDGIHVSSSVSDVDRDVVAHLISGSVTICIQINIQSRVA